MVSEILAIVLIVIAVLVILISAVLLIPFRITANASVSLSHRNIEFRISWLGLILWRSKPSKPAARKEEKKAKPLDVGRSTRILSLLRDSAPTLAMLARQIRRAVHIHKLFLDVRFGSDDPAETALLAGYLWSVSSVLNLIPQVYLSFRPEFEIISLDATMNLEARVRALFVAFGLVRAYTKKPFRRLLKEARR